MPVLVFFFGEIVNLCKMFSFWKTADCKGLQTPERGLGLIGPTGHAESDVINFWKILSGEYVRRSSLVTKLGTEGGRWRMPDRAPLHRGPSGNLRPS